MKEDVRTMAEATVVTEGLAPAAADRAILIVYYEQRPGGRTRLIDLPEGAEVTFGRSRTTTIHIDSERVSRTHARLCRRGSDLVLEDLGSRNGTRVNGSKIEGPTKLRSGDEIGVGPVAAVVSVTTHVSRRSQIATAIATAAHLDERLAAEVDRGRRYHRAFALLLVQLRGADAAVDQALDRLVSQLRPMDTMAEYSPDQYAILLPEADPASGMDMARRLVAELRPAGPGAGLAAGSAAPALRVHAALAAFPTHGTQAGELLSRVQAALRQASSPGPGPAADDAAGEVAMAASTEPTPGTAELIIGDPQMQRVYALVRKVADTGMTVLIVGETGVGKEVVAEAVHRESARRDKRYVRLNCASIPENLLESELFGHERGAFTGADRQRIGFFEAAHGGTLFLDEIGELSPKLQAKLLRVLEQRRFTRVGGTTEVEVDTRVVCATNRDLEDEVRRGTFREDLFFRISAFTVLVPPLRDRRAEIPLLAEHFARQVARQRSSATPRLSAEALAAFLRYAWPGNVRELRNTIERACVLEDSGIIELEHLPDRVRDAAEPGVPVPGLASMQPDADVRTQLSGMERAAIVAALEACNGNQTHAARKLGLSRRALIYKLEKYGLKDRPLSSKE